MELFREENGGPDEPSPEQRARIAAIAQDLAGGVPSAADKARIAAIAQDLDGGAPAAAPAKKTVGVPSAAGRAEVMEMFREENGGPDEPSPEQKAKGIGKPPSAKDQAEVMELFREENGGPDEPSPEQKAKGIGKPPSAKDQAEVMEMFREVNGGPGEPAPDAKVSAATAVKGPDVRASSQTAHVAPEFGDLTPAQQAANAARLAPELDGGAPSPAAPSAADRARIAAIAEDLDGGEPSPEQKAKGIGKPPSAKDQAEVMELFREENGGPDEPSPEQKAKGIGKPPSAKDQAEVMEWFREENGGPDEPSPEQKAKGIGKPPSAKDQAEVMELFREENGGPDEPSPEQRARIAAIAQDLDGGVPSAADKARIAAIAEDLDGGAPAAAPAKKTVGVPSAAGRAEVMELFREENGGPDEPSPEQKAKGIGKPPSAKDQAEVMEWFREENGGPDEPSPEQKAKGIGKPPSAKDQAEVMEMFREENGGPDEPSPEQKAKGIGKPPSAKDQAEVMEMFREVNGGPGEPAPGDKTPAEKARIAAIAQDLDGGEPSPAEKARIAAIAEDLDGGEPAKKTVGVPSAAGRAEAMELFREENGGPSVGAAAAVNGPDVRASAQRTQVAPQFGDLTPAAMSVEAPKRLANVAVKHAEEAKRAAPAPAADAVAQHKPVLEPKVAEGKAHAAAHAHAATKPVSPEEHAQNAHADAERAKVKADEQRQKELPYDKAASQEDALASAGKPVKTEQERAQRKTLESELQRQVQHASLQEFVVQHAGEQANVVSIVFEKIKHVNDDLVGQSINTMMLRQRDAIVQEVFAAHGISVVDQTYKSSTLASTMEPAGLAEHVAAALAEIDAKMHQVYKDTLDTGGQFWAGELAAATDPEAQGNARKRLENINNELANLGEAKDFKFPMSAGTAKVGEGGQYKDILDADMNASKAARMNSRDRAAGGENRLKHYNPEEFVKFAQETTHKREELAGVTMELGGKRLPVLDQEGNVNRDILRAARKNKVDVSKLSEADKATYKKLKDYMDRVNSLDYMKHFTSKDTGRHEAEVAKANELIAKLRTDAALTPQEMGELQTLLAGDRMQQDTASEAAFYNGAAGSGERIVLNADIRDMGLELFDSMGQRMAEIGKGRDTFDASSNAADNVVRLKQEADARFRRAHAAVLDRVIAKAAAKGDNATVVALEKERTALVLLGGDELTVSLHPAFKTYGLLGEVIAVLQQVTLGDGRLGARVAVTATGKPGGKAGHIDAMEKASPGHDRIKHLEQDSRDLENGSGYLSGADRERAVQLADEMKTWHTEQVDGESQLFDANGQAVDETEVKALLAKVRAAMAASPATESQGSIPQTAEAPQTSTPKQIHEQLATEQGEPELEQTDDAN